MPRIAYFILAHAHPEQLTRLVTQLNCPSVHFYIHIDANTPDAVFTAIQAQVQTSRNNITFIERQPCRWGGFSLVDASLRLIQRAMQDGFDFGVLLSGQDYPIHSNEYINNFLSSTDSLGFIDIKSASDFDVAYRYRAWHFEVLNGKTSGKILQKIQRFTRLIGLQRQLPAPLQQIHAGSQWWILSQTACQAVLDLCEQEPQLIDFFKHTLVPDEMFFQTLLMHTALAPQLTNNAMRYLEWEEGAWSPRTFKPEEISQLAEKPDLFARKFAPDLASSQALALLHSEQKTKNKL
ncbi:beta-1,6-N-acetylglucosaminyltransferase [Deefgea rivuli]|uniref:beta-1,6-N-acetylglucosaminyltransferase n=1 Tax=Deefgea rivuli TaxID=400948 RepID=UPI0004807D3D|nr:beta-1,6-N-acetylglucosaminyltransferase [Deefgea rivuli]